MLDIVNAAKETRGVLFHSVDQANKVIDFMYQGENGEFHAFQATIGTTHKANSKNINRLVDQVQEGDPSKKLSLYYLVPGKQFKSFVTSPVDPLEKLVNVTSCKIWHVLIPDPNGNRPKGLARGIIKFRNFLGRFVP